MLQNRMSVMVKTAKDDTSMISGMIRTMMGHRQMMQNNAGNGDERHANDARHEAIIALFISML